MRQIILIFLALTLGSIFYQMYHLTFLIRYSLMLMLFFAFIRIRFTWRILHLNHLWVVILNVALPLVLYFALYFLDTTLALTAFIVSIAPTAAGAPVIAAFLKSKVEYVTASVILTSPVIALTLPLLLPRLLEMEGTISTLEVLQPVAILVFVPLLSSQLLRRISPRSIEWLSRLGNISFYLFLLNICIASGKASHFIRFESDTPVVQLLLIALTTSVVGLILFKVGELVIGRKVFQMENGLSLGRKNTMFALWVALTFINPVIALGPIFYILFQNTYNAVQMYQLDRTEQKILQTKT